MTVPATPINNEQIPSGKSGRDIAAIENSPKCEVHARAISRLREIDVDSEVDSGQRSKAFTAETNIRIALRQSIRSLLVRCNQSLRLIAPLGRASRAEVKLSCRHTAICPSVASRVLMTFEGLL